MCHIFYDKEGSCYYFLVILVIHNFITIISVMAELKIRYIFHIYAQPTKSIICSSQQTYTKAWPGKPFSKSSAPHLQA